MTIQIASFIFGGLLILIGLLGGGFEIKELKIPRVGGLCRVMAAMAGIVFILLGIFIIEPTIRPKSESSLPSPTQPSKRVHFTIFDKLEPDLIERGQSEKAILRIDGNLVGHLTVDDRFPQSELHVTVANEGQHSFAIEATAVFLIDGKLTQVDCYGTGMIDVVEGSRFLFEARYDEKGGPCLAWLERR